MESLTQLWTMQRNRCSFLLRTMKQVASRERQTAEESCAAEVSRQCVCDYIEAWKMCQRSNLDTSINVVYCWTFEKEEIQLELYHFIEEYFGCKTIYPFFRCLHCFGLWRHDSDWFDTVPEFLLCTCEHVLFEKAVQEIILMPQHEWVHRFHKRSADGLLEQVTMYEAAYVPKDERETIQDLISALETEETNLKRKYSC